MLESYREYMTRCARCSNCKFIPHYRVAGYKYAYACPSISRYNFHTYSGGGRLITALCMTDGIIEYSDNLLDIIYQCQMCGACDISCKYSMDLEVLQPLNEIRSKCVEDGQLHPVHMIVIDGLKKEDNMLQESKAERGNWAENLDVKNITEEQAEVYYHNGCRYSFDEELRKTSRGVVDLLKKSGVDFGIAGKDEACCGGRAYELGYQGELIKYAQNNIELLKVARVKTVVTNCSDCYYAFSVLYDKLGLKGELEIFHITEYLERLIKEGKLRVTKGINQTVTYHDPCHLGRLGEPWIHWEGVMKTNSDERIQYEPKKEFRRGTYGVYEPPRNLLKGIPGLRLVEMTRIKEYTWCCGAGGGVIDAYPDFGMWTAKERIKEARDTGAQAIVTACPWCVRNFRDAVRDMGESLKIYDVVELLEKAI